MPKLRVERRIRLARRCCRPGKGPRIATRFTPHVNTFSLIHCDDDDRFSVLAGVRLPHSA
jgi:hypothetical protein